MRKDIVVTSPDRTFCQRCNADPETLIHLFWDCTSTRCHWIKIVPSSRLSEFFNLDVMSWMLSCLKGVLGFGKGMGDDVLFATMAWWTWKDRNYLVFNRDASKSVSLDFIPSHSSWKCGPIDEITHFEC
ncbi:hypothetical protein V2J09_014859 [Rumex salicifolius]